MPVLSDSEFRMVAEVVAEMARFRGTSFDKTAKGAAFARAALIDPAFKARLAEVHRRLLARRSTDMPRAHRAAVPGSRTRCRGGAQRVEGIGMSALAQVHSSK